MNESISLNALVQPILYSIPINYQKYQIRKQNFVIPYNLNYRLQNQNQNMSIIIKFGEQTKIWNKIEANQLLNNISECDNFYCVSESRVIHDATNLQQYSMVTILPKLRGGKGGFGAKLKNEGGKKVKPNQNMFSRDIQGRPIVYTTIQRDYKDFCSKKLDQERKVQKQLSEFKVMENTLKEQYAFMKLDRTYNTQIQETQNKLSSSLKTGLNKYYQKQSNILKDTQLHQKPKGQEDQQEVDAKKRPRYETDHIEGADKGPIKKIKPNQQVKLDKESQVLQKQENKKQQLNPKKIDGVSTGKLLSARDKLKNLFKK